MQRQTTGSGYQPWWKGGQSAGRVPSEYLVGDSIQMPPYLTKKDKKSTGEKRLKKVRNARAGIIPMNWVSKLIDIRSWEVT